MPPHIPTVESTFEPIAKCEQVVTAMPKRPAINHHGARACYSPALDTVSMPESKLFESGEGYYSTLFHELIHSTGHVSRLNRREITDPIRFGSDPYSREELVAEMGAAFLCGHCGIENKTIDQSAGYIQSWLGKLKEDRRLVVHAAVQAQKACDFILDLETGGGKQGRPNRSRRNSRWLHCGNVPCHMTCRCATRRNRRLITGGCTLRPVRNSIPNVNVSPC